MQIADSAVDQSFLLSRVILNKIVDVVEVAGSCVANEAAEGRSGVRHCIFCFDIQHRGSDNVAELNCLCSNLNDDWILVESRHSRLNP